jgi:6,7-dimethyl-8-ribityllumazine synthase
MSPEFKSSLDGRGLSFAVVVSRFNETYTARLLEGALKALAEGDVADDGVDVIRVPGAFEIPLVARRCAGSGKYAAVICLGAVIRSDTPHFDYVAGESARGIMNAGLETDVPVIFGVMTLEDQQQAEVRTQPDETNRGYQAAQVGLEMATLLRSI